MRKYSINKHLQTIGSEFDSGPVTHRVKHDDENDEEYGEGSVTLNADNFDRVSHQYVNQHNLKFKQFMLLICWLTLVAFCFGKTAGMQFWL